MLPGLFDDCALKGYDARPFLKARVDSGNFPKREEGATFCSDCMLRGGKLGRDET